MNRQELSFIKLSFFLSTIICAVKFVAYFLTHSLVILADALETIINVVASAFAWYSIYLSAKPKDREHPYGHGKVEFFSIGFEGAMILIAGFVIIYEAVKVFIQPAEVHQLGAGVWLAAGTGVANFLLGYFLKVKGKKHNSLTLRGNGEHIMSDAYTSLGVIVSVGLIILTGYNWIDPLASVIAALIIIYTGFKLMRKSVGGLMDETDMEVVNELVTILKDNRHSNWIDLHNLRVQQYGNFYHVDCHVTMPYYFSLEQVHDEITQLDRLLNKGFEKGSIEFFIHTDPCIPESCKHCIMNDCVVRKYSFVKKIDWTKENMLPNKKHAFAD